MFERLLTDLAAIATIAAFIFEVWRYWKRWSKPDVRTDDDDRK